MDMHLHTNFSDGENTPFEMTKMAISLGYNVISFMEHVWYTSEWLDEYIYVINELKARFLSKIRIFCGVESKVLDHNGNIDFNEKYRGQIDIVLASIHKLPLGDNNYVRFSKIKNNPQYYHNIWSNCIKNALENPLVDGIAHVFNIVPYFNDIWSEEDEKKLINYFCSNNKLVELNVKYYNDTLTDFWDADGLKVIFSSDSHNLEQMSLFEKKIVLEHIKHNKNKFIIN